MNEKEILKIQKENVSIRIPSNINKQLTNYVAMLGMTKNAFILNLIYQELNKESQKNNNNENSN
ncbi:MAG: hypothetical protein IJ728_11175 [Selenomonadaceae bacterium]|nr:hypothetical protein [Selenomonadaceae bacterium]